MRIRGLGQYGLHTLEEHEREPPVVAMKNGENELDNLYGVFEAASPSSSVQGSVSFPELLRAPAKADTMLEGAMLFPDESTLSLAVGAETLKPPKMPTFLETSLRSPVDPGEVVAERYAALTQYAKVSSRVFGEIRND